MQFAQLLQLRETGVPIPDSVLLEASTMQNKKDLVEAVEKEKQAAQQAQEMQMKVAMEEQKARTDLAHARAIADRGLGMERVSRIQENEALAVERRAEAVKDRYAGVLNLVRALKEIEGIEIDQVVKMLELAEVVSEREQNVSAVQTGNEKTPLLKSPAQQQTGGITPPL